MDWRDVSNMEQTSETSGPEKCCVSETHHFLDCHTSERKVKLKKNTSVKQRSLVGGILKTVYLLLDSVCQYSGFWMGLYAN